MTGAELKTIADGLLEAAGLASPGLAFVIVVAEPDPAASPFAVATNAPSVDDATKLLKCARIALAGS